MTRGPWSFLLPPFLPQAGKTPTDLVQLWQGDTRDVLEKQEPNATEMPA